MYKNKKKKLALIIFVMMIWVRNLSTDIFGINTSVTVAFIHIILAFIVSTWSTYSRYIFNLNIMINDV